LSLFLPLHLRRAHRLAHAYYEAGALVGLLVVPGWRRRAHKGEGGGAALRAALQQHANGHPETQHSDDQEGREACRPARRAAPAVDVAHLHEREQRRADALLLLLRTLHVLVVRAKRI